MRVLVCGVLLLVSLACGPEVKPPIEEAPKPGQLRGSVSLSGATEGTRAEVLLPELGQSTSASTGGDYSLVDLPAGTYTLVARASGYEEASTQVTVAAGRVTTVPPLTLYALLPELRSTSPLQPIRGGVLVLHGRGFGPVQGESVVRLGTLEPAEVLWWSDTELRVRVPRSVAVGAVAVSVTTGRGAASRGVRLGGAVPLAGGSNHSLVLASDQTVKAFGSRWEGALYVPADLVDVIAVAAGSSHGLALTAGGTVVAWGDRNLEPLGTAVPEGLSGVVQLSSTGSHALALKADGTVVAWGRDDHGQATVPPGLSGVKALAAGGFHSLALREDGTVVAWGREPGRGRPWYRRGSRV